MLPRLIRPAVALVLALILLAMVATLVLAETRLLDGKLRTGETVTVPAGETVADDLYLAGGTLIVDGTVHGDLVAFGGSVNVNGTVDGDLIAAGGNVSVGGTVNGDARLAGGTLSLVGTVGEDVLVAGGQITLGGQIKGDLITSGGNIAMGAAVGGDVEATAGNYSKSGQVAGSERITITTRAAVTQRSAGDQVLDAIRHFAVLVFLGALAVWLLPRALQASDETLRREPLLSLAGGVATFLGYAVFAILVVLVAVLLAIAFGLLQVAALAAISVVAGLLALFIGTFGFILAVAYAADLVVGLTLARLAMRDATAGRWQLLGLLIAGALVVVIITSLPVIGGLAKLAVVLLGLGAMALAAWRHWRRPDLPPATAMPPAEPMATPSA
jgi:cytoskeletal protein CcmA (bactofilin family)